MTDKMKAIYLGAMIAVLAIWMGGVVALETMKTEVDRGFLTQISGLCVVILGQIGNTLFNSKDNKQLAQTVKDEINK